MSNSNLVRSLLKGLDILTAVGLSPGGLRLSEIAEELDLKLPTTHNLVRTLMARGFLTKGPGNRYLCGPSLAAVAGRASDRELHELATDSLRRLAEAFPDATVTFSEAVGSEVRFSLRMSPDQPGVVQRPRRRWFQPYANASGLAHLAFGGEELAQVLSEHFPFHEFGAHLWGNRERLDAFMSETRERGVAAPPFGRAETIRAACPVMSPNHGFLGCLGISFPAMGRSDAAADQLVQVLQTECKGLSMRT